ncbi:MAG: hypothetical protein ACW99Q_17625 [Candidatus Kariarchaeaceae archaeon]|jgi:hypothetical protein
MNSDSLVIGIQKAINNFGVNFPTWYISGATGLSARFSLSMNVKTGREIGHPSSNYIWDIISTAENCFNEIGINWELYINKSYYNRARRTSAQSSTLLSEKIQFVKNFENLDDEGKLIFAHPSGVWKYQDDNFSNIKFDIDELPFGVVGIKIKGVKPDIDYNRFPSNTLKYLIKTLERGEEPMEISGKGNYSAVSGWKAFARWMQAYSMPLEGVKHEFLDEVINLLKIRRIENGLYWLNLSNSLDNKIEKEFAHKLHEIYSVVGLKLTDITSKHEIEYKDIKEVYFNEQETLPIYKKIKSYLIV